MPTSRIVNTFEGARAVLLTDCQGRLYQGVLFGLFKGSLKASSGTVGVEAVTVLILIILM